MRPNTRLSLIIVAAGLVLFAATALLGSTYHRVREERTQQHLAAGRAQSDPAAALAEYRAALRLDRDNDAAARALALTLLELGRTSEAETYLADLLRRFPTDGALNRGLARVHVRHGREAEARAEYQRAIYGEWPADSTERIETRFELIDYLTRLGAREDVLAELLRLKAELPPDRTAAVRRVADLFVQQGVPDLAIAALEPAVLVSPRDVELLAHYGDLQLAVGRSADARSTLRRALTLEPGRQDLDGRLRVVDRVLTLDPTLPNLRLVTRARRARQVLSAVQAQTGPCETEGDAAATTLRQEAARLLARRAGGTEASEAELDLALRLWTAARACRTGGVESRALEQVLRRVAQAGDTQP